MTDTAYNKLKDKLKLKKVDIRTYSPLSLAYIGDSVYDTVIKTYVLSLGQRPVNEINRLATKYVSAKAQSRIIEEIKDKLTDDELSVYKRGRNSKPHTGAKNATLSEYLKATGFEALIGYLYLNGDEDRMVDIIHMGIDVIEGGSEAC